MRIIPAIDIIDGKCVRLKQGAFDQRSEYSNDPIEVARKFAESGFKYLHLVDLDGARTGKTQHLKILEKIAAEGSLRIDFSGGLGTIDTMARAFDAGANQIMLGSLAVKDPLTTQNALEKFGPERAIISADLKDNKLSIRGWQEPSDLTIDDIIEQYVPYGLKNLMSTNVSKDGMLEGTDVLLYKTLRKNYPELNLIASGGISSTEELFELRAMGVEGAIVGKALYEGTILTTELKPFL